MSYYPPPPPAYNEQQQQSTVIITGQPTAAAMHVQTVGDYPMRTRCPACSADILTSIHYEVGAMTWVACICLAFIGLGIGCCLFPFCMESCKDIVHNCPNCQHIIGRKDRL